MAIEFDRLVSAIPDKQTEALEHVIRPQSFNQYIGQKTVREQMQVFVAAARERQEPLDHTLLYGPSGLGKTTLATIIANEMQTDIKITAAPLLTRAADLAAIISGLSAHAVLFIDEIHRLPPAVEECLYPAMEDYRLDIVIGEGVGAKSIKIDVPPFTLVGATTRAGLLTAPLRSRFGITQNLQFYNEQELTKIVLRAAKILGCTIDDKGAQEIAKRARGTPRIANKLLRRVRDYAQINKNTIINASIADAALNALQIDQKGLDEIDLRLLRIINKQFQGGPVGLKAIAALLGEDAQTVEEMLEPFLLQQGYLQRTAKGRVTTKKSHQLFATP